MIQIAHPLIGCPVAVVARRITARMIGHP
jgi:hypothetical protein